MNTPEILSAADISRISLETFARVSEMPDKEVHGGTWDTEFARAVEREVQARLSVRTSPEPEPGDWAIELGPLQQGDIELMEDAIDALEDLEDLQIQHALHGLTRRVIAARKLAEA